jgi:hypothetical protein
MTTLPTIHKQPAIGSIRDRLEKAAAGEQVQPVYAVYDWFVNNRTLDWASLFEMGLGRIMHADIIRIEYPHLRIEEKTSRQADHSRRDVRWITDQGELHEYYLDNWRQEYLVKRPEDYRILRRAMEDARLSLTLDHLHELENIVGDAGIVVGQLDRTPLQKIQIDLAGLERFALDLIMDIPELMELVEMMNAQQLDIFRLVRQTPLVHLKLWENLSIETIGHHAYRRFLVPHYRAILELLEGSGKQLQVHYDGQLRSIAQDIAELGFAGIDSLTPPPEGNLSVAEARAFWPGKFFWLHPSLTAYCQGREPLLKTIRQMMQEAGSRFCLMISEEVPFDPMRTIPWVLEELEQQRRRR